MKKLNIFFSILLLSILFLASQAQAECALVLTSPADGAVFTGASNQITIYGYVKAQVDPGYGYIELTNNGQHVQRWEGTFTSANQVLQSGSVTLSLSEGANNIVVEGDAAGCSGSAHDEITVYYQPGENNGPDDELGGAPGPGDGPPRCQNFAGDPVNISTGNVFVHTTDFKSTVPGLHPAVQLHFERFYNSRTGYTGPLGHGWTHNYNLTVIPADAGGLVGVRRAGGQVIYFTDNGDGTFSAPPGVHNQLTLTAGQYVFSTTENITYTFNDKGKLLTISDLHGNTLTMQYSSTDFPERLTGISDDFGRTLALEYGYNSGLITKMTDPAGNEYLYGYGVTDEEKARKNLMLVSFPSGTTLEQISYAYNDAGDIHNLTGITDENGQVYTYTYDGEDRAVTSVSQGGTNSIALDYSVPGTVSVTNGRGFTTLNSITEQDGMSYVTQIAPASTNGGTCSTCGRIGSYFYDTQHHLASVSNANGITTQYTYDGRGNITGKTEAQGTPDQRQTSYTIHPTFNKPEAITTKSVDTPSQNRVMQISYDAANGLPLSVTISGYVDGQPESRTTTLQYTSRGQLQSVNGPRTDVSDTTFFDYYADTAPVVFNRARLHRITNALGQVTEFSGYNQFGYPQQITDMNGVVTQLSYGARGRLTGKTINGKLTSYSYDLTGHLVKIQPPGVKGRIDLSYTPAGQLESIHDQLGNYVQFSYDNEGNRTEEQHFDSGNILHRSLTYEYDSFNRLQKIINPDTSFTLLATDNNGNVVQVTDAMNRITGYAYDSLDRLNITTEPNAVITAVTHDSRDNPTGVTDPENYATTYHFDDFGNLTRRVSADTCTTEYTYDPAGNTTSLVDAESRTSSFAYDALNRLTAVSFADPSQNISYLYDEAAALNGIGRLTSVTDPQGSSSFQYDSLGRITRATRTTDGISGSTVYTWNDRNNPVSMTYPTGTEITIQRYDNETVSGLLVDGQPLTENVSYLPFGPEEDVVFGNNLFTLDRSYATGYFRLESINTPTLHYQYQYYADGRVKQIDGVEEPALIKGRTEYVTLPANNRMDYVTLPEQGVHSYSHDNNGNITSNGVFTYTWNQLNQLIEVHQGTTLVAQYGYDGFGRRVKKTVSGTVTLFYYDLQNRLIAETDGSGTPLRDYIYQNDNLVALKLYGSQAGVYYVISDHLGTPQQVVDSTGTVVWKAAYQPFGKAQVITETITSNLRFPGQYFDAETGLHYNLHRYYDPATGRYISADPIGLQGGINLYAYVQNDPVDAVDPWGLWVKNNFDKPILIKPEHGPPEWLDPGECYNDDIDGVKPPRWDGDWYKVKGNDEYKTNVTIDKWGFPTPSGDFGGLGGTNFPDLGSLTDPLPGRKRPEFEDRHPDWKLKR